ncbi:protein Turandot X [Drosophila persimilis]|uniref:Protein Turandot X n=1 Tax=Drosophila persimilis TaxID=7234 RepID=TOTX_DROPE|nr:protein Turandot X [Drosophila persimilis]B4G532.2 RecName: Full=Protein Turandot X; Flags: Precursor [Drosophila persimilis]
MKVPVFQLSCLLCLIVCLLCSVKAQKDDQYDTEKSRILEIYNNPAVDEFTKERNIPKLIEFYRRYPARIQLPDADKRQWDEFVARYTESQTKLVDGLPAQGGWVGSVLSSTVGNLIAKFIFSLIRYDPTTPKPTGAH